MPVTGRSLWKQPVNTGLKVPECGAPEMDLAGQRKAQ